MNAFLQRKLRQRQRQVETRVEKLGGHAESLLERYFFRRLERLGSVRRFVISWLLFFVLLSGCVVGQIRALDSHFQTLQPIPGGVYSEGVVGDFTNANPLYASSEVDETVSKLIFASLFTYDDTNQLVGDLADSWSANDTGKVYTVKLKPHLTWQDGAPLTSRDVVYTYNMIQNPDAGSILNASWRDIKVAAIDDVTLTFTLPNVLISFPYNMTNGIIPEHILGAVPAAQLRAVSFNTSNPVGAGPFSWQTIQVSGATPESRQEQIALVPFESYHAGAPKLSSFVVHAYHDSDELARSFERREVTGASFLKLPKGARADDNVYTTDFLLTAANMVFFRQGSPLMAEAPVRQALVQAVNVPAIISGLGYATHPVKEPLLQGQLGYDPALAEPGYDPAAATAGLEAAGWKAGADGIRTRGGTPLSFSLYVQDSPESRQVTRKLQTYWRAIGVRADIKLQSSEDLQRIISSKDDSSRSYDALLYGISIGVDPDVFVYWHSSQNDARSNRLNFSEYNSKAADEALASGRTRTDASLRVIKYKPFLQAWQHDLPALGLYQPRYLYATHGRVFGLNAHSLNTDADRFNSVNQWQIRQAAVTNR